MENQKELALNVQLISISEQHKEHTILEEFLTTELHKLIPEINNNDINWTDVKNKLGNELINNNYPTIKDRYFFSIGVNVLLITGIAASALYKLIKK
jgi:hypothetical protein